MEHEKRVVVTIVVGEKYEALAEVTHPSLKAYAEKVGADFHVWKDFKPHTIPAYQKLEIAQLLKTYDRVLYVDTDIIIREDAPNLFDLVPSDHFGAFNEYPFGPRAQAMYNFVPDQAWIANQKYFNTGVMVCSREHANVFEPAIPELDNFYEQTYLNHQLYKHDVKTFCMNHKLNRMSCMDLVTGESRHDSYFLHYAGNPLALPEYLKLIKNDLKVWEDSDDYIFPKNIFINAHGGLGDVVASEPAIRFCREKFWQHANITIQTHNPEVFTHLKGIKTNVPGVPCERYGFYHVDMIAQENDPMNGRVIHALCHPTDYASLMIMKGQMPVEDKRIKLSIFGHKVPAETQIVLKRSILLHPGKGWESKTFPAEWWSRVAQGIKDRGAQFAVMGKRLNKNQGIVEFEHEGIDLVDKLNLRSMFKAIELAPVLISNDSSPIHIAGAFDNWIGFIASCKEPYRILPFRNGSQDWRAENLSNGSMDVIIDPTFPTYVGIDRWSKEEQDRVLPDPDKVSQWAVEKLNEMRSL